MSKLVTFDQLNPQAKTKAINDFAAFYVPLYQNNHLEIIGSYDHTGLIWDINRNIWTNKFNSEKDIIKLSAKERAKHYAKLLEKIGQKFFDNGNPQKSWKQWYHDQYYGLEKGL